MTELDDEMEIHELLRRGFDPLAPSPGFTSRTRARLREHVAARERHRVPRLLVSAVVSAVLVVALVAGVIYTHRASNSPSGSGAATTLVGADPNGSGWLYTLDPPSSDAGARSEVTVAGVLIQVHGPGRAVIAGVRPVFANSQGAGVEVETSYLATVNGTLDEARGSAFISRGSLQTALHAFNPPLAAWTSPAHADGTTLTAGPYYLVAIVFSAPSTETWELDGFTVRYRVDGGPPQSLSLKGPEVRVLG